jgi:cell division protein FtsL
MKKQITFAIVLFSSLCAFAQVTKVDLDNQIKPLTEKITTVQSENSNLKSEIARINSKLLKVNNSITRLQSQIEKDSIAISTTTSQLGIKIQETETSSKNSISQLDKDVNSNRLYWIIATLLTLLLGGLIYWLLGKRIASSQTDVEYQIRNTKKSIEEESLRLDGELVKVFQKQLEVLENNPKNAAQDEDHSLVLKIADRLTAMETNLYRMDPNTRGLNNLKNLVKSTKENFNAKEYEIVEMLGNDYKDGMEVIATFIPSDEIEIGKQIITRIIKPQVNFKGKKIQAAQIEVSIGE